ncbi:MAG: P1 family peptidase [Candidatus Melainabacteria bacterium]
MHQKQRRLPAACLILVILLFSLSGRTHPRATLPAWRLPTGALNAITDVPGVRVGHVTLSSEEPVRIRTGVTAIVPHSGNLATQAVWAAGRMLNGNGELTGLAFINDTGLLNAPILLTNTLAIGAVHTGVMDFYRKHHPGDTPDSTEWPGQLPVVGECWDGYFNTIEHPNVIQPGHGVQALETAGGGPVATGRVGAGTGMRSFELHAGIGTASRTVPIGGQRFTLGVLVNSNHSRLEQLSPSVRQALEQALGRSLESIRTQDNADRARRADSSGPRQGSIIIIVATDAPLNPTALDALCRRAVLGIGAMGGVMNTTSGDGVIAFSTARLVRVGPGAAQTVDATTLHPDTLTPLYEAVAEAVTEAQMNAILSAHPLRNKQPLSKR